MTDSKTAPPVFAHFISPPTGTQFQLTCNICPDSHRTQVWLCFLVLSLLTMSTCALSEVEVKDVLICLEKLKVFIEDSDAMLYAPSVDVDKTECAYPSLKCYMLELIVVIHEERIEDDNTNFIYQFNEMLHHKKNPVGCPPCEAYPLRNTTMFLRQLKTVLAYIASKNAEASKT